MRVLLVEDTLVAQVVAKAHMEKQGCKVDIAESGASAIEKSSLNSYDLILMDIGLGDGPDGFEVTQVIKTQCPLNKETPIAALSSHESVEYMQKATDAGMVYYFNKPFTPKDVQRIITFIKSAK